MNTKRTCLYCNQKVTGRPIKRRSPNGRTEHKLIEHSTQKGGLCKGSGMFFSEIKRIREKRKIETALNAEYQEAAKISGETDASSGTGWINKDEEDFEKETTQKFVRRHVGDKYIRAIYGFEGEIAHVDIYDVNIAFEVECPARQHVVKKILCSGLDGKGTVLQDLEEAQVALSRAIELEMQKIERFGREEDC